MEEIKPKKERKFLKAMGDIALILFRELVLGIGKKFINKIGNKRQGLVISFVILASTFAIAQFPNTGNKQRLGFQTTGDGLVWRGSISDTASIQPINNQNAWVILDTVNLKMYSFDFTSNVWNLVGGAPGLTMPFDSITFNTAKNGTVGVGEVEYNDTQGSLIQGLKGGNVTNVIGQQLHQRVNNRTGAPLAKGDVVYLAGSQGNRITVAKGLAVTDAFSANTFGVVAENIADNASGFIITEGLITGLNTSALTEDSAVYLSPTVAGALTSIKPQAPQHSVYIGVCVKSNNSSGELFVKIRNGLEMDELHDTRITNPVTGATLYYSGGLWRDTTAALLVSDTASMLTPYLRKLDTITLSNRINTKLNISDTASMLLPYLRDADTVTLSNRINLKLNIADTSAFARDNQISGTSGQVAYFNSSSSVVSDTALRWSATNKSLGINMTTVPSGANLIIKNSQEPVRTTVVANQTFTGTDTLNWTRGTGWTFNNSVAVATAATGELTYTPALDLTAGDAYEITFNVTSYTSGTITPRVNNASYLSINNAFLYTIVIIPSGVGGGFRFLTSNFTGQIDNVSVVKITKFTPILLSGQDDGTATLYNPIIMPNSTTLSIGGGGRITTGANNLFFGSEAGTFNTTGTENNFFGSQAGFLNTTGIRNNFFGLQAGYSNTTGGKNNFFGFFCGYRNISGSENNFFGSQAGQNNIDGYRNNFFGTLAGGFNTSGFNNNFFGYQAGASNTTGGNNNFFGYQAGASNTTGSNNNFFGSFAAGNNTTGQHNTAIGTNSLASNTIGLNNVGIGQFAGRIIRRGEQNIAIGFNSFGNTVTADTLTGSNNIAIGTSAADNIAAAAAGNVAIGNQVDLPTNNGSNQGVYQNVLFFTGASGTGTTIAAASKAGIKTNAPNRDLEVAGEVRITDLTTDAPTRLVGADADGDLGQVTLGAGLSLASSSLLADTNFLVTRFDTAAMLTPYFKGDTISLSNRINAKLNISDTTNMLVPYIRKADTTNMLLPYFRDADTTSLNLTSRFAAKLNLSDTASMLTNYLRTGTAASTYLTQSNAASTYLPLTGGTLSGDLGISKSSNSILRLSSADVSSYGKLIFSSNNGGFLNYGASIESSGDGVGVDVGSLNFLTGYGTVRTNRMTITPTGNLTIVNSATIGGTLGVTGVTTLSNSLYGTNQGLSTNLTISDIIPGNPPSIFTSVTTGPSTSATVKFGLNQSLGSGGANMFMGGSQLGGGSATNPNIFFTDTRRSYASIQGIYTGAGITSSGHIAFNTTPNDNTTALTERMRIASDGAITMGGTLGVTGSTTLSAPLTVNSSAVFNEGSTDSDFRVESDGNANMVFVDASTDRVGIGTNSPTKTLDVNGELNVLSAGTFGGRLNTNWMERTYSNSTATSLTVSVNTTWLKLENNSTITLTLPNAATYPGKELHIKNAGTGAVNSLSSNIEPLNSTTIGTAILASGGGKWATLVSDGTYWVIMAGN